MERHRGILKLDSPRPPTISFLRARSSEISGILKFAQYSPHPVAAHSLTRTCALLQQVRQRAWQSGDRDLLHDSSLWS